MRRKARYPALIPLLLLLLLCIAPGCNRPEEGKPAAGGDRPGLAAGTQPAKGVPSEAVRITSVYPGPDSVVDILKAVRIEYNRPLSPDLVRNAVHLEPAVPVRLAFEESAVILLVQGLAPAGVTFSLTVDGPGLEPFRSSFKTAEAADGRDILEQSLAAYDSARELSFSMYEGPFFTDRYYPFEQLWEAPGAGAGAWGSEGRLTASGEAWYSESTEDSAAEVLRLAGRLFGRNGIGGELGKWLELTDQSDGDPVLTELARRISTPEAWGAVKLLRNATEVHVLGTEPRDGRQLTVLAVASPVLESNDERQLGYDLRAMVDQADGRLLGVDFQILRSVGQEAGLAYSYWTGRCTYQYTAGPIEPPAEVVELMGK